MRTCILALAFHGNATINGAPIQTLFDGATQAGATDSHALKKGPDGWKIMAKVFTQG